MRAKLLSMYPVLLLALTGAGAVSYITSCVDSDPNSGAEMRQLAERAASEVQASTAKGADERVSLIAQRLRRSGAVDHVAVSWPGQPALEAGKQLGGASLSVEVPLVGGGRLRLERGLPAVPVSSGGNAEEVFALVFVLLLLLIGAGVNALTRHRVGSRLEPLHSAQRIGHGELGLQVRAKGRTALAINEAFNRMSRALAEAERTSSQRGARLQQMRALLAEAERIANLGTWELNMETWEFYWSEQAYRIFGEEPDFSTPSYEAFLERVHPEDRTGVRRAFDNALENDGSYEIDHRIVTAEGEERWLRGRAEAVGWSDRPRRLVGTILDISDSRRAQEALRSERNWLETLIDAMPDIVCLKDGAGRWLVANRFALRKLRLERAAYQGQTDAELASLHPFFADTFLESVAQDSQAWQSGQLTANEERIICPSGESRSFDMIRVPLFEPDEMRKGLVLLGRDITERRRAEGNQRLAAQVFESSIEGILITDASGVVADRAATTPISIGACGIRWRPKGVGRGRSGIGAKVDQHHHHHGPQSRAGSGRRGRNSRAAGLYSRAGLRRDAGVSLQRAGDGSRAGAVSARGQAPAAGARTGVPRGVTQPSSGSGSGCQPSLQVHPRRRSSTVPSLCNT